MLALEKIKVKKYFSFIPRFLSKNIKAPAIIDRKGISDKSSTIKIRYY
jgi:hypothetical protein